MAAVVAATLLGNLYLFFGTLLFAGAGLIGGLFPPHDRTIYRVAVAWSRCLLAASLLRLKVEREAAIDPRGRYIFMANHQSLFDIPVLLATLPGQTRFLAKKSLFRIPFFGWALSAMGFIPVDREDRSQARTVFSSAFDRLTDGTSVLIFPEETRSLTGQLLPFQRGGFLLALKSGLPIVPVGLSGTLAVQPKTSFAIHPGPVGVRYGSPLEVAQIGLRQKPELIARVRSEIARLAGVTDSLTSSSAG